MVDMSLFSGSLPKMSELGFFPLTISGKDIECYWVRIQSVEEGKHHSVTYELYDDILEEKTGLLESLKRVAKMVDTVA